MITNLTPEQQKLIPKIRDEWLQICQSGKEVTIQDVEKGVTELYALDGRKKPLILILNDPLQCQYLANILSDKKGSQIRSQIGSQIYSQIRSQIYSQIYSQIDSQIDSQIYSQIDSQIDSQIYSQIDSQKLKWFDFLGGLSWRSWYMSYFEYYLKIGLDVPSKTKEITNNMIEFLKKCIWELIVFENVCIISKTPKTKRNDKGRLHSVTSKAVEFPSGYGFYAIDGVVFDEKLWNKVANRKLSANKLLSLENVDQRFVAMNHYGFEKIIDRLDKNLVNKSDYGNELYTTKFNDEQVKFLVYPDIDNPKEKRVSFVNPILKTAKDAMAWKHNCTEEEYMKMEVLKSWS